ncbi:MAG: DegT/DnrJ/EryC1/StrS family aminotransferase [Magnetococcales bacterium]|nr:DegT/DnrJ/EryC1/StrS family aminotransferase [Magnetococcales bacterium]
MTDLTGGPEAMHRATLQAVERVLASGKYVLDREVVAFERLWAEACGVRFGIGVGNGMDAITIGLLAQGIGPGDEVIVPAMTAFATVLAVIRSGATPVLADIDPVTTLLSLESAQRMMSRRTRAVVVVHLYGRMAPMSEWVAFCHEHGVALIEDGAQAHLARLRMGVAGSFGVVGAFSFYPTKNLGAIGDAGMLVTDDESIVQKARQWRDYGRSCASAAGLHVLAGLNSRLDELQAALLSARLPWLEGFNAARRAVAAAYRENLNNPWITLPSASEEPEAHVHHQFVVTAVNREALRFHLRSRGIQTGIHYALPLHWQPACPVHSRYDPSGLFHAEQHAHRCLSLPCHPFLTMEAVERVIQAVNDFVLPAETEP